MRSVALKMKCEGGRSAGRFSQRRERILDFSSVRVPRTFRNPFVHLVKSLLEAAVVKSFSSGGGWGHAQIFAQANKPEAASPQRPTAAAAAAATGQTTPAPGLMDVAADLDTGRDQGSSSAVRATCA